MSRLERDPGPVPDRWLNCPRKSLSIISGKFLAFKTPLNHRFHSKVGPASRWQPEMVFDVTKSLKSKLGLWIDLTNTERFYDPEEVKAGYNDGQEVVYVKMQCRGHGETPTVEQTQSFINLCKNFISRRPLEIIGVHCTHGFNRTGFLIVSYLVETEDLSVECALQEFARCRPPGIYKGDYIKELYRRYDDVDDAPDPPLRPTWCFETNNGNDAVNDEIDNIDDELGQSEHFNEKRKKSSGRDSGGHHHKRFKGGKVPQFMHGISGVSPVLDQPRLGEIQRIAQEMCGWRGKKGFPGSQPVSMDMRNINYLKEKPYRVSWKADGTRYMMLIKGENEIYFLDRDNSVFEVSGVRFVHRKNLNKHLTHTLLDGEMVIDKHEGKDIPRYLVYDIVRVDNIDVSKFPFYPERLDCIEADIIHPRHKAIIEGKIDKTVEPFSIRRKTFFPVEKAGSFLSKKFSEQLTHEPDGLIFQPSKEPYIPGTCESVLKWKPASHNSVDFKLKIITEDAPGILRKKVGYLYVGGSDPPFATMKYTSSIKDYHNKIIECRFENNNWVFMRERTDKSFPNHYSTAMSVCDSITNPVTKEYLLRVIERERFRDDDELMPPPPSRAIR
ncbi:hypothetical protein O3M35_005218 [Rhynocoris fuscipes]|uniref:mRNA-capping enzyme n=1 Tax=Rhynocoris fuscipes TaxID=488301 RepID=A0AAW1DJP3_9HEMI